MSAPTPGTPLKEVVELHQDGALIEVRLTDSAGGNLVSNAAGDRIVAALATLDPEVKLVRISADGRDFCLGRISPMPKPGAVVTGHDLKVRVAEPALRVYDSLRNCPVPVLSVVRGSAAGYGCGLVAASDLALAGQGATFSIPELERNIPPTLVMTAMGGRVPYHAIAQMVLSREPVSAAQALAWGLVGKVVADADLDAEAEALTQSILGYSGEAVRAVKEYLRFAPGLPGPAASSLAANLAGAALSARFGGTPGPRP
jgi:enoyl-CoA hydratase/carnithine racemase